MGLNQGLRDGLGGDRLLESGVGAFAISPFILGSLTTSDNIVAGGSISAQSLTATSTLTAAGQGIVVTTGSPFGAGLVVQMTARTIISGGQFVSASGGLAYTAPTSTLAPIGIATGTAQSGATVNVLINGIAPVIAEGTIAVGAQGMMGAGGAQNCILAVTAASGLRHFEVLDAATSGGTVFIRL